MNQMDEQKLRNVTKVFVDVASSTYPKLNTDTCRAAISLIFKCFNIENLSIDEALTEATGIGGGIDPTFAFESNEDLLKGILKVREIRFGVLNVIKNI